MKNGLTATRPLLACLLCLGCLLAPAVGLAGNAAVYRVVSGDNLSVIAARFGVTVNEIRQSNSLKSDVIHVDQELRINNPLRLVRSRDVRWARPVRKPGQVLRPFGQYKVKGILMPRTGTDVASDWGTTVTSPANGVVRHIGSMDGLGLLVIIEHGGGYATVLAPFDPASMKVELNQAINRGAPIGRTGPPDDQPQEPFVHLELRKDSKSIKPDRLLK